MKTFTDRVAVCVKVANDAHRTNPSGAYLYSLEEREVVTNGAFLRLFISFEEFLENSFTHYATGRMSIARWRPSRFVRPLDADHVNSMLLGTQRFVDWSTPDTVRKHAKNYFLDGDPFEVPLASSSQHLNDMKTVRNATAHLSRSTQAALDALWTRWTGTATAGSTAYGLLLSPRSGTADTFLTVSERTLSAVVAAIANRA